MASTTSMIWLERVARVWAPWICLSLDTNHLGEPTGIKDHRATRSDNGLDSGER